MSLDDEVRKHLRDTGEQVALTPGIVDAVRVRAATRLRRRRRLLTGVGFLAGVALVGGSLAVVNLQPTPKDGKAKIVIHSKVDGVMRIVMRELGIQVPPYRCVFARARVGVPPPPLLLPSPSALGSTRCTHA